MISFYDIDYEALKIAQLYTPDAKFCNEDATKLKFSGNDKLIINTSCEHMSPVDIKKSIVAFQSNDYFSVDDHVNCVNNVEELINQYDFKEIYYKGELDFNRYQDDNNNDINLQSNLDYCIGNSCCAEGTFYNYNTHLCEIPKK